MIWKTRRRATMAAAFCVDAAAAHFDASATQDEPPAAQAPAVGPGTPQNPQPEQVITIHATRDPVDKSYRKMIRGMDRYARQQSLAPGAVLRFRLLPRLPGVGMDGITLKIVGDTITLPVPLAPDHSFTLPRNAQALREDAALIASRKTNSMTWRADVRSPGVPAGMRRLGDLRLECLVGVEAGLVSNSAPLFAWLDYMLTDPDKVCSSPDGNYLFFAERPLFGVTLQAGARRCRSACCTRPAHRRRPHCPTAIARCCSTAPTTRRCGTAAGRTIRCSVSRRWTTLRSLRRSRRHDARIKAGHIPYGVLRHAGVGRLRGGAAKDAAAGSAAGARPEHRPDQHDAGAGGPRRAVADGEIRQRLSSLVV